MAIERYRPLLVRKATAMVGPNLAEDLVQEAILVALRLEVRPDSWSNWLFVLVHRRGQDWHRRQKREEDRAGGIVQSLDEILEKWN